MNLEEIEEKLGEIKQQPGSLDDMNHSDAPLGYCTKCWLLSTCRDLIAEVKLTIVELETLKKEYAVDKAIWEREKADLEAKLAALQAEVKFRVGQVEEKCLTIDSLTGQLAALQTALAEERGRTMEWEFRAQHQTVYHPGRGHKICSGCDGDTLKNERHNWSRQQWTEAAKRRS